MRNFVLTSESMTKGHPDKLCDQISDAMVDACLASDPKGGIVAECAVASGVVFLSIRHRRPLAFDPTALARRVIAEAGYDDGAYAERATVMLDMVEAPELPGRGGETASSMATVFGYACGHTPERMPAPIWAAHRLCARLDALRAEPDAPGWLGPDAQVQVAQRFTDRRPAALEAIALTIAAPETPPDPETLREILSRDVIAPALAEAPVRPDATTRVLVLPTKGPGGPRAHAGLTGRKTPSDAYGAFSRHGGSALSGKDPSRVERVAAYAARQAALSVLTAGLAEECEVQLSYAPGDPGPSSVEIDSFGSGAIPDEAISARLRERTDFRLAAIADRLDLWRLPETRGGAFYRGLASYGHFGRRDLAAPWEETPEADRLGE